MILKLKDGEVEIELFPKVAPNHVKRFQTLADEGKYDGVVFHRVIEGFMAQSGDVKFGNSNSANFNLDLAGTGAFGPIRDWFASLPEAKARGYKIGRFSFNVKGGRCETCEGDGVITYEMHFLPDVFIPCDTCKGTRYNRETLEIRFKDKNIADVLDMTVDEGCTFFENIQSIRSKLITLKHVGLGYIKIGQQATTLSGGEAQRIKLAKELSKRSTGRTLYILDEPTTGLHSHDIKKLLEILQAFVNTGNTVVVIEHNLDVIKTADWIVDMGPEGGINGGKIIAEGTPEKVSETKGSYTGEFLKKILFKDTMKKTA